MTLARSLTWRRALLGGLAAVAACAVLPIALASLVAELVGIAGVTALFQGARRNGAPDTTPFALIAAGGATVLAGNVVRFVHGAIVGVDVPFPSPADLVYYAGYALVIAGVLALVRRRSADVEGDNALDAVLVAACIGALVLSFVVVPLVRRDDMSGMAEALTLVYTLFDIVLIGGMVRLAVGSGRRNMSYYFLGAAASLVVVTDILAALSTASPGASHLQVTASALSFTMCGLAGLHPSVATLTARPEARDIQLHRRRLVELFAAVLGMVVLMLVALPSGDVVRVGIGATAAIAAILVVLARLALLVVANERKAEREAMLRAAAGELASATTIEEMRSIVSATAEQLLGADVVAIVPVADVPETSASTVVVAPVPLRRGEPIAVVASTARPVARHTLHAMETLATHLGGAIEGLLLAEEMYRTEQEERFRALIEHSSDLITVLDGDGLVAFASPACVSLLGITEAQMLGRHPFERVHPDDRFDAASVLDRAWSITGVLDPVEARFRHESGEWRWFEVLVENLLEQPEVGAVIIHARDISDRRRAQEELVAREARFRSLVQHTADLVAIVDDDLVLTYVSPAARSILGYEPDALLGRKITELVPEDELFVTEGVLPSISEARLRDVSGIWRPVELTITDLRHEPAVAGIVVNARDVTERKTLESKLRHLAMHDPLTGLANRNLFHDRLAAAVGSNVHCAVLYIDVDDFKAINDSLGHGYGDTALCVIARRLVGAIRDSDLAARFGADEFAVLLEGPGAEDPMEVAGRLLDAIRAPIALGPHRVELTVSLGASVRADGATVESLTRDADIAMYLAKTDGKDRKQLFEPAMLEAFNERIELTRDLRDAIERSELEVLYQPVFDLTTAEMTSVEALLRWNHPTRGLVMPVKFIALAEESGTIGRIGAWVLDRACAQLAEWRAAGAPRSLSVGVNVSAAQLEEDGLIARVERALRTYGLEPGALTLELTETVLATDIDLVQLQLSELSSLGVRLALDDFGTGYSALGYLRHFHLDTLKIDRSFLTGHGGEGSHEGLLRAIIDLAKSHGMATVAEGVEVPHQLALLRELGCDAVQGYLFADPLRPEQVLAAMDRARPFVLAAGAPA